MKLLRAWLAGIPAYLWSGWGALASLFLLLAAWEAGSALYGALILPDPLSVFATLGDLLALPEQATYYGKSLFIQNKRYELGMTRGGLFFFGTPQEKFSFDLRYYPETPPEQALYKWYFTQGGRGGL